MNYTLNQLRIFLKITHTGSITKAAEELHLTQPAVSIQLKNFQEQFEIPLTEIVGRQLYVTDFGKEVAALAEQIIDCVGELDYKTHAHKGQIVGRLKISTVSTGKYVMPYFLADFLHQNPGIELVMDVTNKARVIESLEKNEIDFSLVSLLPETLSVDYIRLMQNKLFCVAGAGEQSYNSQPAGNIFEQTPMIFREQGSATRLMMEQFIRENGFQVSKKIELTSNEAVKQAVIAGLGASIMPLIGIKNELNNGELHIIPVHGLPVTTNWYLAWPRGKKFSVAATAFKYYVQKEKEVVINKRFRWIEDF